MCVLLPTLVIKIEAYFFNVESASSLYDWKGEFGLDLHVWIVGRRGICES